MPTPIGHALAGIAAGACIVRNRNAAVACKGRRVSMVLLFATLGMLADIDFLGVAPHRHATHSLVAVGLVGAATALVVPGRPVLWVASAAAYGTHVLLDWLGRDTVAPFGIMALWPFDRTHYQSSLEWFWPVCREYWLLDCWVALAWAVGHEVLVLGPLALAGGWLMGCRWPRRARQLS